MRTGGWALRPSFGGWPHLAFAGGQGSREPPAARPGPTQPSHPPSRCLRPLTGRPAASSAAAIEALAGCQGDKHLLGARLARGWRRPMGSMSSGLSGPIVSRADHPARLRLWRPEQGGNVALAIRAWLPGWRPFRLIASCGYQVELRKERQAVHFQAHASSRRRQPQVLPQFALRAGCDQLIGEEQRAIRTRIAFRTGPVLRARSGGDGWSSTTFWWPSRTKAL